MKHANKISPFSLQGKDEGAVHALADLLLFLPGTSQHEHL